MYVAFASDPSADRLQKDLYLTYIWFIEESKIKVKGVLDKRNFLIHTNARRQFVNREVSSQYLFSLCKSDKTLLNLGPEKPQACPPCHLRKGYLDRTYLWKTGFCWEEKKNLIKQIAPTIDQPRSAPGFALIASRGHLGQQIPFFSIWDRLASLCQVPCQETCLPATFIVISNE